MELGVAAMADVPAIRGVLDEVRAWLAARGSAQWARPFTDEWIAERVSVGEFWIAREGGEVVGVVRMVWADPVFWGELEDGSAVYVHTLATGRIRAGRGTGAAILAAVEHVAEERGRRVMRLDCGAENAALCGYYEGLGFVQVGEKVVGGEVMALYERAIASGSRR